MSAFFPAKNIKFSSKNVHNDAKQIEHFQKLPKKFFLRFFSPFSTFGKIKSR